MKRKSICPVCEKTFEVFLRNQVCCSREHQAEWRKIQRAARDQRRIMPDDLDWANAKLEKALEEMAQLKADKAILKMERICAKAKTLQSEDKTPEKEETQKSASVEGKSQNSVENAQETKIKGKGKYLKECENCMHQFRTTDNRDRFCCDACRTEYAREMGI